MSDKEDFLEWASSRLRNAEEALHNGDAAPRLAIWSEKDPVSVFGAWKSTHGQEEVMATLSVSGGPLLGL